MMPPGDLPKDRKLEQKVDMKKKTQAELEQEMAALQYTNPILLEVHTRTIQHKHTSVPSGYTTNVVAFLKMKHLRGIILLISEQQTVPYMKIQDVFKPD